MSGQSMRKIMEAMTFKGEQPKTKPKQTEENKEQPKKVDEALNENFASAIQDLPIQHIERIMKRDIAFDNGDDYDVIMARYKSAKETKVYYDVVLYDHIDDVYYVNTLVLEHKWDGNRYDIIATDCYDDMMYDTKEEALEIFEAFGCNGAGRYASQVEDKKIDEIERLWDEGLDPHDIAAKVGKTVDFVVDHIQCMLGSDPWADYEEHKRPDAADRMADRIDAYRDSVSEGTAATMSPEDYEKRMAMIRHFAKKNKVKKVAKGDAYGAGPIRMQKGLKAGYSGSKRNGTGFEPSIREYAYGSEPSVDQSDNFHPTFSYKRIHVPTGNETIETQRFQSDKHFYDVLQSWNKHMPKHWRYEAVEQLGETTLPSTDVGREGDVSFYKDSLTWENAKELLARFPEGHLKHECFDQGSFVFMTETGETKFYHESLDKVMDWNWIEDIQEILNDNFDEDDIDTVNDPRVEWAFLPEEEFEMTVGGVEWFRKLRSGKF